MDSSLSPVPCTRPAGHADWATYFLGYLRAVDNVEMRSLIVEALEHAQAAHGLPAFAEEILDVLSDQLAGIDVRPF